MILAFHLMCKFFNVHYLTDELFVITKMIG